MSKIRSTNFSESVRQFLDSSELKNDGEKASVEEEGFIRSLEVSDDQEFNFDCLLTDCLGEFGLYQKLLICMLCLPACFFAAFNNYDMVFLAYSPAHRCKVDPGENFIAGECTVKYAGNGSHWNRSEAQNTPCERWTYSRQFFDETLVTEWDLVCHRELIIRNIISLTWLGSLLSVLLSYVQDRWGRKMACILNVTVVTVVNLLTILAPDFYWFTVLKFLCGLTCMFNICMCWSLEFVGPSKRTLVATVLNLGYAVATTSMVFFAHVSRTWRELTLILHGPFLLVALYSFWLPESPRWLFTNGKVDQGLKVLAQMARWNRVKLDMADVRCRLKKWAEKQNLLQNGETMENLENSCKGDHSYKTANQHVKAFFRSSNLRLKLILLTTTTSIGSQLYTAVPFYVENMRSDFLLSFLIQSLVEAPAMLLSMYILDRFGRVWPLAFFMSFGGFICLLNWPFDHFARWAGVALSSVARFFICVSVPISNQLANELYPTVTRGLGSSFMEIVQSLISISVQYILYSRNHWEPLPMVLIGSLAIISGVFVLFLPETKDQPLPDTVPEAESLGNVNFSTFRFNFSQIWTK